MSRHRVKSSNHFAGSRAIRRCVVAGGSGQVGHMFSDLLASSRIQVTVLDIHLPSPSKRLPEIAYRKCDVITPSKRVQNLISRTDLLLVALPEKVALCAIKKLGKLLSPGALLADTLSVKSRVAALLRAAPATVETMSLNPMFGPSLGIKNRPMALINISRGSRALIFEKLLLSWGAKIVHLKAGQHDRLTAAMQVVTHMAVLAFGLALRQLNVDIQELSALAPPPNLALLAIVARMVSSAPNVYWEIQSGNPNASMARKELQTALTSLINIIEKSDEPAFCRMLGEIRSFLGTSRVSFSNLCKRTFQTLQSSRV